MDKDGMEVRKGYDGNAARTPFPRRLRARSPLVKGDSYFFFLLLFSLCVVYGSGLQARKE